MMKLVKPILLGLVAAVLYDKVIKPRMAPKV